MRTHSTQPSFKELEQKLTGYERKFLDVLWREYESTSKWPATRVIHSQHGGKSQVRSTVERLGGNLVIESEDYQEGNRYQATLLGVLLSNSGDRFIRLIERYLEYLRLLYQTKPNQTYVDHKEVRQALRLGQEDCTLLGKLIVFGQFYNRSCGTSTEGLEWSAGILSAVEDFPSSGSLRHEVEKRALAGFVENAPVFVEDRRRFLQTAAATDPFVSAKNEGSSKDPFKRRYQVFVSSTHDDLVDERRHVMHSLLQTKCIPTGMELFPAASEDKWKLIKRVIDDCDYYVVIVAGRYGSLGPEGKSYTEMEFDYAVSSNKSVMGFYHSNPDTLPVSKSERTEIGKQRLEDFAKKVKRINSCASWSSPEGLSSAIKSAILNAMEHDPKPGWVRAGDVPSPDSVYTLKQALGLKSHETQRSSVEKKPEIIQFPAEISYYESEAPRTHYSYPKGKILTFGHTFEMTLDQIFLLLAPRLSKRNHRVALKNILHRSFEKEIRELIPHREGTHIHVRSIHVDRVVFDKCLQTFLARKLLKRVSQPKHVRLKEPYWQLDKMGFLKLAELQSF